MEGNSRFYTWVALLVAGFSIVFSCSNNNQASLHDSNYVGVGSVWVWDLNSDGTFRAEERESLSETATMAVDGTYQVFDTGFYKFTVTAGEGTNAPEAGSQAFGFAVPGVILVVKPLEDNSEELVMPAIGDCPTTAFEANWVEAKTMDNEGDLSEIPIWGKAILPLSGAVTGNSFYLDGTAEPESGENTFAQILSCSDGVITVTSEGEGGEESGFIAMTQAGVGLVTPDETNSEASIVALPRGTSVTEASMAGDFVGLLFMEEEDGSEIQPMNVTFDESGNGIYYFIEDVETGEVGESGTLDVVEVGEGDKAGFVKIEVGTPYGDTTPTMWGAVAPDIGGTGKAFFFASGMNVSAESGIAEHSFSVIAVGK